MKRKKLAQFLLIDLIFVCLGMLKLYGSDETKVEIYIFNAFLIFLGIPILGLLLYAIIKVFDYILYKVKSFL